MSDRTEKVYWQRVFEKLSIPHKQYSNEGFIMHDENGTETNQKSHYVNLAGITLPGMYVAKLDTRVGVEYRTVRVDLTMFGNGEKELHMFNASNGDSSQVTAIISDNATYFGPLPLE